LQPATWLHEVGIASNRSSARCGESFSIQVQTARQAFEVYFFGNWLYIFQVRFFQLFLFFLFFLIISFYYLCFEDIS